MTNNQKIAYELAKSDYPSIAARYARELAGLVDDLQEAYDDMAGDLELRTKQVRQLQEENASLRVSPERNDPQWISVEDRLPTDEDDAVLAVVSGSPCENITLDGAYELATYIEAEGWIIETYPEWETPQVTHWMPLPEPPEEDGHG